MNRSFDIGAWGLSVRAHGTDITIGNRSVAREFARRKDAFYLDANGLPTCQELCPADLVFPILATRLVTITRTSSDHVECRIAARVPITASIVDVAFPGTSLAGARLVDFTLIDDAGHRRTVHAEGPPRIGSGSPVLLALTPVASQMPTPAVTTSKTCCRECASTADGYGSNWICDNVSAGDTVQIARSQCSGICLPCSSSGRGPK